MISRRHAAVGLAAIGLLFASSGVVSTAQAQTQTVGLFQKSPGSSDGYTLFSPQRSNTTYLLDSNGHVVHTWTASFPPGLMTYLTPAGTLLRAATDASSIDPVFANVNGSGGIVEEYDWDGTLLWQYTLSNSQELAHHDIVRMPNGNVLLTVWDYKTQAEAIAQGRNPTLISEGFLLPDKIIEVQPTYPTGGTIVWEWHAWDHLIQDFDPTKLNFGVVTDHPELIDLNWTPMTGEADWLHINGIAYNAEFDQIIMSVHRLSELWVIDHSTTTAEAAGHTGGTYGKGGDLLYRWGNPQVYDRGLPGDQQLFGQHDTQWIAPGLPGAGNILLFNNGFNRPAGNFSTIEEIVPPVNATGFYTDPPAGLPYGPASPTWTYSDSPPTNWFSRLISGTQRLPNGNTLVCSGVNGRFFETTNANQIVWEYVNPVTDMGPLTQGDTIPPQGPFLTNSVFKIRQYPANHPGLAGKTLVPMGPIESFTNPQRVPNGSGGTTPVSAVRMTPSGSTIDVAWDAATCTGSDYNLIYGDLGNLPNFNLLGSECAIGTSGAFTWSGVPAGDLFFLVVGAEPSGLYESSWGVDGSGGERGGSLASQQCGVTTKDFALACP